MDDTTLGANVTVPAYNFNENSLTDVLHARDLYHWHLLNKHNVIGTAIGLYLIRKDADWPTRKGQKARHDTTDMHNPRPPRTLSNSEVREYSWPCVIVLVRKWEDPATFAAHPSEMVPKMPLVGPPQVGDAVDFYKVVVWYDGTGDLQTTCYRLTQKALVGSIDFEVLNFGEVFVDEQVPIRDIERRTGLKFHERITATDTYAAAHP